ncbi:hypothetical protein Tco_1323396, partial [Tanacetum coccineum]
GQRVSRWHVSDFVLGVKVVFMLQETDCSFPPEGTSYSLPTEETCSSLPPEKTCCSLPPEETCCSLPPEETSCSLPPEETSYSLPRRHYSLVIASGPKVAFVTPAILGSRPEAVRAHPEVQSRVSWVTSGDTLEPLRRFVSSEGSLGSQSGVCLGLIGGGLF